MQTKIAMNFASHITVCNYHIGEGAGVNTKAVAFSAGNLQCFQPSLSLLQF